MSDEAYYIIVLNNFLGAQIKGPYESVEIAQTSVPESVRTSAFAPPMLIVKGWPVAS